MAKSNEQSMIAVLAVGTAIWWLVASFWHLKPDT
jgi:hypothetical protein